MSATPAFSVAGLGHSFGPRRVLKDVTFSIAPGDFTVLLGLNGAGKTTLFSLATRLYAQAEGTIRIFGMDIRERMLDWYLRRAGATSEIRSQNFSTDTACRARPGNAHNSPHWNQPSSTPTVDAFINFVR